MGMGVEGDGEELEGSGAVDGDLRSAISDAFDSAPDEPANEPGQHEAKETEPEAERKEEPEEGSDGRDEKGRFRPKAKAEETAPKSAQLSPPAGQTQAATTVQPVKAPQSWKPAAREKWAALPPDIQQEVSRREREMASGMAETAEARKFQQSFQQAVSPYLGMIQAEGSEPLRAVGNLLQTAAALRTAPAHHKAQLVAQMVRTFGVPIDALDAALSGQAPSQGQQQQYMDPNALTQQVTKSVIQTLTQQREQALLQRGSQDVEEFKQSGEAEFFEDVQDDIADLLDMASKRGQQLTLQDAYKKAVALHPDLSEVFRQREEAKRAGNVNASTQRAKQAGSSIKSQPSGMSHVRDPENLRDFIEAAWSSSTGR